MISSNSTYQNFNVYYGDLHNHCHEVGYGYGSVAEAYNNARQQLDFASVTAHAYWPDIPQNEARLVRTVNYHLDGFKRASKAWQHLLAVTEDVYERDRFVSFPSFEWHSLQHGDHNVYFKEARGDIIRAANLAEMRTHLRQLQAQGLSTFLLPHHIGYLQGHRGINWNDFSPEFSPVVEIISMHGLAESDDALYPYLHTMGPRDERGTMQYALKTGKIFGVIGSTDHHSAFPGSYGYGRVAVWADELSREGIWEAIAARRTYALSGDRIRLAFSINGAPMGAILPSTPERQIDVDVTGGDTLDYVELLHNNRVIHRWNGFENDSKDTVGAKKVFLELGWGEQNILTNWQVELDIIDGKLLAVEPRFRGRDILAPKETGLPRDSLGMWERCGENSVHFSTQTWGNPTIFTPATQGVCLEILGTDTTKIRSKINKRTVQVTSGELASGARTGYLGDFLSPAYCFHRAVPSAGYTCHISFAHQVESAIRDWYYVRVRQKNNQGAWSSPIWIDKRCD